MKKISVYWHPNCSTCKKAVAFLKKYEIAHELHDLREKAPAKKDIAAMMHIFKDAPKKLFNVSGQAYREENLKDKLPSMTPKEMEDALAKNGLLIKRPFVLLENGMGLLGFDEKIWERTLIA